MVYSVDAKGVAWKGKVLKGIAADRFEVLSNSKFARIGDTVFMIGKPLDVDAATFEILSEIFAKDARCVFEIMDKKLKAISGADAASFTAVGQNHGEDAKHAWWRSKKIAKAKVPGLRELDPHLCTDGTDVFFVNKAVKFGQPLPIDLATCELLPVGPTNHVNMPVFILRDERAAIVQHKQTIHPKQPSWSPIESEHLSALGFVDWRYPEWISDGKRLLFDGRFLAELNGEEPEVLGRNVLRLGARIFVCDQEFSTQLDPASLIRLSFDEYADVNGIWRVETRRSRDWETCEVNIDLVAAHERSSAPPQVRIETFFAAAMNVVARVRESLKYYDHWETRTDTDIAATSRFDMSGLKVTYDNEVVTASLGAHEVTGQLSNWFGLTNQLWAKMAGDRTVLQPYPHIHHMSADGTFIRDKILDMIGAQLLGAVQALYDLGNKQDAILLGAQWKFRPRSGGKVADRKLPGNPEDYSAVSADVLIWFNYKWLYEQIIGASTYMSGAKRLIESGALHADNPLNRYEAAIIAHELAAGTQKDSAFLKMIVPHLHRRIEVENVELIRMHLLCAMDIACRRSVFDADWLEHARPYLNFLISEGVNVPINEARLDGADA